MAKQKLVTHLPASPPAPRLAGQLVTAAGELIVVAAAILGIVVAVIWLRDGYDLHSRIARHDRPPGQWLHCWRDRYGGELCRPEDRGPPGYAPVRRHFVSD
jgi:hypothetical protein